MGDAELVEALKEARREAFNLRLRNATGELENSPRLDTAAATSRGC